MRMPHLLAVSCVVACATTSQAPAGASEPAPGQLPPLESYVGDLLAHIEQNDFAYLKASACPQSVVMWDIDEHGAPVEIVGKPAVEAQLDKYQMLFNSPGTKLTTRHGALSCETFAEAGYCLIPMDQTMEQSGQPVTAAKLRTTLIARRHRDKWIWTHWHASTREIAPPMAGPLAATTAETPVMAATPAPGASPAPAAH